MDAAPLATYLTFLQAHRGLSARTLARRAWHLARLGQCLESLTVRSFLGWAYGAALVPVDLRAAVRAPRRFRQGGIRDVLTETDAARILAAVERSSAIGQRDYAVLLLAARYGLRPSQIRHLTLEVLQ